MNTINNKQQDMPNITATILPYEEPFRPQLVSVWEKSVRATHGFLAPADIDYFKKIVKDIDFHAFGVYCLMDGNDMLGFLGVAHAKIEMLFLHPHHIGQGFGKQLILFALNNLQANKVDVNEQNTHAIAFYQSFGFTVYNRLEKDSAGKDYPILQMQLGSGQ